MPHLIYEEREREGEGGSIHTRCRNIRVYRIKLGGGVRMVNGQRGNTRLRIQFRILCFVKLTGAFVRAKCYTFPLLQCGLRIDNTGNISVVSESNKVETGTRCYIKERENQ